MRLAPPLLAAVFFVPLALADGPAAPDPAKVSRRVENLASSVSLRLELIDICRQLGKEEDASRLQAEARTMVAEQWHLLRDLHVALGGDGEIPPRPVPHPDPPPPTVEEVKLGIIGDYREGRTPLTRVDAVIQVLRDHKEQAKLRQAAADAIRLRFRELDRTDREISGLMVKIAAQLLPDLNHRDLHQRVRVAAIFQSFWPGQYARTRFDPKQGTYRSRYKAWKEWRKFLLEKR